MIIMSMHHIITNLFGDGLLSGETGTYIGVIGILTAGIVALIVLFACLWRLKESRNERTFTVTRDGLREQSAKIREYLLQFKVKNSEINTTLVLLEEIVVRMHDAVDQAITARVEKFLGDVRVQLFSQGEAYNPLERIEDAGVESEDYLRDMIIHANKEKLSYSRRGGKNLVTLTAHAAGSRSMYYTMYAMFLGILFGLLMRVFPADVSAWISDKILNSAQTMFMNALYLLLAPVLFFSIVTGFSSISSGSDAGRIGAKAVAAFLGTTIVAIITSFILGGLLFKGIEPLPLLTTTIEGLSTQNPLSLQKIIIDIIPHNILIPISEGNMLQIIFVAVFCGIAITALGDKVSSLKTFFAEANELFLKMISMVIFFMPLIAFSAMAVLVFSSKLDSLYMLIIFILVSALGGVILIVLNSVFIFIFGHISPINYVKKSLVYLITPFMLASSCGCIPMTIEFCRKKLGIPQKITSFIIPLGATVNMNGAAMLFILTTLLLAKITGTTLTLAVCLRLGVLVLLAAVGASGVPNGGLIVIAMLLPATDIPVASLGYLLGIWNILDRIGTALNVNGDIVSALLVARSEKELDTAAYKA